jgi:CheY-like chemotaxis protein
LQVVSAGGREGLELFRAHPETLDLVVLDLGLPGPHGLQALAALRAARPDVRVVLTSGTDLDPAPAEAGLGPPLAFLAKPYTVHALLEVVVQALASERPGVSPPAT